MSKRILLFFSLGLAAVAVSLLPINPSLKNRNGPQHRAGARSVSNARVAETYGKLPLSFEANQGQTDSDVKFLSRGSGYSLFLTSNEAVLALHETGNKEVRSQNQSPDRKSLP
jgi:hypothetical protein